jgi:hypothetical protein
LLKSLYPNLHVLESPPVLFKAMPLTEVFQECNTKYNMKAHFTFSQECTCYIPSKRPPPPHLRGFLKLHSTPLIGFNAKKAITET